jgi:hypothetical protein
MMTGFKANRYLSSTLGDSATVTERKKEALEEQEEVVERLKHACKTDVNA